MISLLERLTRCALPINTNVLLIAIHQKKPNVSASMKFWEHARIFALIALEERRIVLRLEITLHGYSVFPLYGNVMMDAVLWRIASEKCVTPTLFAAIIAHLAPVVGVP